MDIRAAFRYLKDIWHTAEYEFRVLHYLKLDGSVQPEGRNYFEWIGLLDYITKITTYPFDPETFWIKGDIVRMSYHQAYLLLRYLPEFFEPINESAKALNVYITFDKEHDDIGLHLGLKYLEEWDLWEGIPDQEFLDRCGFQ